MQIKESWKNSLLYKQGKVELVPTDWVWKYWGRDVSPMTNLMDGTLVDMDTLWEHISENGMHEPLIMRIGLKNKKFRLEAGNHRIQLFHKHNIKMIPLTVEVRDECGPHTSDVMNDASHNFDFDDQILISDSKEKYLKPSEVFRNLK